MFLRLRHRRGKKYSVDENILITSTNFFFSRKKKKFFFLKTTSCDMYSGVAATQSDTGEVFFFRSAVSHSLYNTPLRLVL